MISESSSDFAQDGEPGEPRLTPDNARQGRGRWRDALRRVRVSLRALGSNRIVDSEPRMGFEPDTISEYYSDKRSTTR